MSDIFDEVDEILGDVDATTEEVDAMGMSESNFNESELQDIMAEIESLEKDFVGSEEPEVIVVPVKAESLAITTPRDEVKKTNLQEEIEKEMEMAAPTPAASVLSFEKKSVPTATTNSEITFQGAGQMTMNLGFKIGTEEAKLSIDPVKGLTVTMNGVELVINEETGCSVTMENGVHFTIPLTASSTVSKKKAV